MQATPRVEGKRLQVKHHAPGSPVVEVDELAFEQGVPHLLVLRKKKQGKNKTHELWARRLLRVRSAAPRAKVPQVGGWGPARGQSARWRSYSGGTR